ncbi:sulfite exporter TauE/SafE family protein [Ectothiorhodospiraceae bacterium BW-2]|nr:sulfite exporter TauE/SafE family protein [Ectothiorhodospiraceae bacterium BW-2]
MGLGVEKSADSTETAWRRQPFFGIMARFYCRIDAKVMVEIVLYAALGGAVAGLLAGLMGIGGGLILVPLLIWLFEQQWPGYSANTHLAIGTTLATIIPTALSSSLAHHRRRNIDWQQVRSLTPSVIVGTLLGALLAHHLSGKLLLTLFIGYLVTMALKMLFEGDTHPPPLPSPPASAVSKLAHRGCGLLIGSISAMVGIGGGTLSVPCLLHRGVTMRRAIGTSSFIGLPLALAAATAYAVTGQQLADPPPYSTGYLYWPLFIAISPLSVATAPLGSRLAHLLPLRWLKKIFALLLIFTALKMVTVP